jgi:hypothetical protein
MGHANEHIDVYLHDTYTTAARVRGPPMPHAAAHDRILDRRAYVTFRPSSHRVRASPATTIEIRIAAGVGAVIGYPPLAGCLGQLPHLFTRSLRHFASG